ncbi:PDC sensor domain-containing protein [Nocardioides ultimimeridianus]
MTETVGELDAVLARLVELTGIAVAFVTAAARRAHAALATDGPRRSGDLAVLDDSLRAGLEPGGLVHGGGFVAAVGALDDARWWLEWFARDPDDRPQRLVVQTDSTAMGFYDYEHLPWYTVPRETGRAHITGPYVDYLCTEDYTLTFTEPVVVDDTFLGVAGCDVKVHVAERFLLPTLRACSGRVAIVNEHGRILTSNTGRAVSGDLIEPLDVLLRLWDADPVDAHGAVRRLEGTPLAVVSLDGLDALAR